MKLLKLLFLFIFFQGFSQGNSNLIEETSNLACDCISKISKEAEHRNREINTCILEAIQGQKNNYSNIENFLVKNCQSLKDLTFSANENLDHARSKNVLAQLAYDDGMDYIQENNFEQGIEKFKKATSFDDQFVYAWDNLGVCYRKTNQLDMAIAAYKKSLDIFPNGKLALINSAIAYNLKKEPLEASKYYERYIEAYPNDAEGYYGLGLINYTEGDLENGLDHLVHAFVLYSQQKSPYRSDAAGKISYMYNDLKKQDKLPIFEKVVNKYDLKINFN